MSSQNTNSFIQFLAGGGEMGQLIREKDWTRNTLGVPETWPQSLRTTLSIILNSKFPMFLFWGSELICFYNDAYRPSLGNDGKHPNILGGRAEDYWKEIWNDIKPMIDQVLQKGESTWNEDMLLPFYRNGKLEDIYWTFSYSPVHDESGKPAGVFVTCFETTGKVTVLQQLKESNQKYLDNLKQAPLAMCILRGKDFVVEVTNDMMLEIWGKKAEEVLNKPVFEGLPEAKEQGLEVVLGAVFTTGEKFVANQRLVQLPRDGKLEDTYINFVYDAIREVDGTISGVFCAATEVTNQVKSHTKLQEIEQKVRAVVENAPFAIAVYTGEEMRIELANETIINIWGKGNDVIGKTFTEVMPELAEQAVFEQIKAVYKTGKAFHTENSPIYLVVEGKQKKYYFNYSFTPLYDLSGKIYGVMNTGVDLTDLNLAKKKIEISEKRFRNTVQQAPVAIAIFRGKEYVSEMANNAYLELIDRKENEFLGRPLFESVPEVKATTKHLLDAVFETGIPFHGNEIAAPIKRNNEIKIFNFDLLYYPLREEDGTISGIIVTATDVTEKVEARKKTEQNEQRLSIVIEASELGTWELNLTTKEVEYSSRYVEVVGGYTELTKLTHEQLLAHLHPDDMENRNKAFKDAIINGQLLYEARVIWKDGSIHWMEEKGTVFYDAAGQAEKIIGTIRDTTKERKDQMLLIENERKFRLLSDSVPQQIWTSDPEGNLNYFNKSVFEYSGLSRKDLYEKSWLDIVHPKDKDDNIEKWKHSITTGEDFLIEHRFRRHDGEYRWQLSRALPQRDEDGKIQMWVGTSTDIQDQKTFSDKLEKQVKERTKELNLLNKILKESEERYHLMVGEVQDYAILYLSKEGIIENWNKGAERLTGYRAEEIIGKSFENFYTDDDRSNNLPNSLLHEATINGRIGQESWRVRKNGTLFWANVVITAIHNDTDEVIGFSKVTHDLTTKKESDDKLKRNAQELQQKNLELIEMNKELQSFAYISSHDLQEPLRKIQTFSNQIIDKEYKNLSENGKDRFQRMQNAAQRMQTLINDLLAYSRTTTQDVTLVKTDLNLIIKEVIEDLQEDIQQKNCSLEIDKVHCEVSSVPFQMHQLLFNLVSNSLKFSRENIPPIIKIKCEINKGKKLTINQLNINKLNKEEEYCHITFIDNGIGFDQQYNEKIFEVFQRLHGKEAYQGTGIGLAIVKKIIDNHKGLIYASGKVNQGAQFDIYFPVNG